MLLLSLLFPSRHSDAATLILLLLMSTVVQTILFNSNSDDDDLDFVTFHMTRDTGGEFEKLFQPSNDNNNASGESCDDYVIPQSNEFASGLTALQDAVQTAVDDGTKRIRAYGSKYSYNNMAFTNEYLIETCRLNYVKVGLETDMLTSAYQTKSNTLAFVQAGVRIREFHMELIKHGLNLRTMGNSDGQRVVGAISTGTHGGRVKFGSTQDFVKGIHLVLNNDEHVYLQRSSDAAVNAAFATDFLGGARLISDDAMFNAALVSFGSFGIIHGIVVEAEPMYRLKTYAKNFHYPDVKNFLQTLDMKELGFDDVSDDPYHIEVWINPYKLGRFFFKGVVIQVMDRVPLTADEIAATSRSARVDSDWESPNENVITHANRSLQNNFFARVLEFLLSPFTFLLNFAKRGIYFFTADIYSAILLGHSQPRVAPPNELFSLTFDSPIAGINLEVAVDPKDFVRTLDIVLKARYDYPQPLAINMRYVEKSNATLAFTKFETTAIVEVLCLDDGLLFTNAMQTYHQIYDELVGQNIDHAFHWGKHVFPDRPEWVRRSYGDGVDAWKLQRRLLLDDSGLKMFSNDLLDSLGLQEAT